MLFNAIITTLSLVTALSFNSETSAGNLACRLRWRTLHHPRHHPCLRLSYRFPLCWSWPWGLYKSAALTAGWTSAFSEGRHTWPSWSGEHWCISCQLVQHPYPESIVASDLCVFESGSSQHFPLEVCHANIEEKSRMACRGCDEKPWPSETWPAVDRWFSCGRKQIVWRSHQC